MLLWDREEVYNQNLKFRKFLCTCTCYFRKSHYLSPNLSSKSKNLKSGANSPPPPGGLDRVSYVTSDTGRNAGLPRNSSFFQIILGVIFFKTLQALVLLSLNFTTQTAIFEQTGH